MAIAVTELFPSTFRVGGSGSTVERRFAARGWTVEGTPPTEDEIITAVTGAAPANMSINGQTLAIESLAAEPETDYHWVATVSYSEVAPWLSVEPLFTFDTGGATQHITQSWGTARFPANAPDFAGAIGVNGDDVAGCDIVVPAYEFAETHVIADTLVTPAYKAALSLLTGCINGAPFKGFNAYEVLFKGAAGQKRGYSDWEITYKFSASPSLTNLTVGSITGISKAGQDYLWVKYKDAVSGSSLVKVPEAVYVERVFRVGDLSLLGI